MKHFVVYCQHCTTKLQQFHSESARNTFVKDFLLETQLDSDAWIDLIGSGEFSFVGLPEETVATVTEPDSSESELVSQELKVGDRVEVIADELLGEDVLLTKGEIGEVVAIRAKNHVDPIVKIQSENPTYEDGRWETYVSNLRKLPRSK